MLVSNENVQLYNLSSINYYQQLFAQSCFTNNKGVTTNGLVPVNSFSYLLPLNYVFRPLLGENANGLTSYRLLFVEGSCCLLDTGNNHTILQPNFSAFIKGGQSVHLLNQEFLFTLGTGSFFSYLNGVGFASTFSYFQYFCTNASYSLNLCLSWVSKYVGFFLLTIFNSILSNTQNSIYFLQLNTFLNK